MHDNVRGLQLFIRECFIAAMLNPSLKSRFTQEFSMILEVFVGLKVTPLKNKKRSKNKKTLKNAFFIKIIKEAKNVFYIYGGRNCASLI